MGKNMILLALRAGVIVRGFAEIRHLINLLFCYLSPCALRRNLINLLFSHFVRQRSPKSITTASTHFARPLNLN